jgi:hypothetical protein
LQRSDLAGRDQKRVGRDEAQRGAANKLPVLLWHCLTAAPIDTEIRLANAPAHISSAAGPRGSGNVWQSFSPLIAGTDLGTVSDRSPGID